MHLFYYEGWKSKNQEFSATIEKAVFVPQWDTLDGNLIKYFLDNLLSLDAEPKLMKSQNKWQISISVKFNTEMQVIIIVYTHVALIYCLAKYPVHSFPCTETMASIGKARSICPLYTSLQVLPSLMTAQKMTTKRKANILLSCHKKVCNNISIHIRRWKNSFLRAELAPKLITNPLAHLPHHFHCESIHSRY